MNTLSEARIFAALLVAAALLTIFGVLQADGKEWEAGQNSDIRNGQANWPNLHGRELQR